jgi:hypothetical protein
MDNVIGVKLQIAYGAKTVKYIAVDLRTVSFTQQITLSSFPRCETLWILMSARSVIKYKAIFSLAFLPANNTRLVCMQGVR